MDRQRFEVAHMAGQYPEAVSLNCIQFEGDPIDALSKITPLFCGIESRYAGLQCL